MSSSTLPLPLPPSMQGAPLPNSGNPVWNEILNAHQNLSPAAKQAMEMAGATPKPIPPEVPTSAAHPQLEEPPSTISALPIPKTDALKSLPPIATSSIGVPPGMDLRTSGSTPIPERPELKTAQDQLSRLTLPRQDPNDPNRTIQPGSGIDQIKHAGIRIPLKILDAIGSGLFPQITMGIPGTAAHHQYLVNSAANALGEQTGQQDAAVKRAAEEANRFKTEGEVDELPTQHRLHVAQAVNAESQPELNQAKAELAASKLAETLSHHQSQNLSQLHQHGFDQDEDGNIIPLAYEKMSSDQQAVHDLKASQQELADANAALKKAQKDNIPKAAELARARIATANQNAATAAGRLGLSQKQYEAEYHGTENGVPLTGAPADEAGNPIGTKVANAGKATGQVASRSAQAASIKEAGDQLLKEIDAKSKKIGNLGSYWTQATNGTPIADPDVAGLMTSLGSFAALQPSLHGFRGQQALEGFEKLIGGVPKNPEALKESIKSIQRTAGIVEKQGQHKTVAPQGVGAEGNAAAPNPLSVTYNGHEFTFKDKASMDKFKADQGIK